ncbi:MAG: heparinase II/III family protein [Myxococcaceae bacterium]
MTPTVGTWWRTLKRLKREQIVGRLRHERRWRAFRRHPEKLQKLLEQPGPLTGEVVVSCSAPALDPERIAWARASMVGPVRLAGVETTASAWANLDLPKLVRYHLHYLDIARARAEAAPQAPDRDDMMASAVALVQEWARQNPAASAGEGWEPYCVSARLMNLCAIAALMGPLSSPELCGLVALHARYVAAFPEVHLLGNHLLKNYCARAAAGLLLSGEEAQTHAEQGLGDLQRELAQQLLADGGHCERSPMYHALLWADLLDIRDLAKARGRKILWLDEAIDKMGQWLARVLHPDGDIPLFNDAVLGQAPRPSELFARWETQTTVPPALLTDLPETGFWVVRPSRQEALLLDAGQLGPPHQPGHAHSDTLSYELSVGGERRVVNAGMDGYQSPHRAFFRSAVAHNTVTVDDEGPDELWADFRVGGRSRILFRHAEQREGRIFLRASLEAFQGWVQDRRVLYFPERALIVIDKVHCAKPSKVVSRARFLPGRTPLRFVPLAGEGAQRASAYAPEFGIRFEVTEHAVSVHAKDARLGYALLWNAQDVRLHENVEGWFVVLDGVEHRVA